VFEIRFPGRLRVESHRHELQERLETDFKNLMVPLGSDQPPFFRLYVLQTEDGSEIIRTGLNFLSYSTLKYRGFAAFRERAMSVLAPALELFRVPHLNRTGLRYVNQIPIALDGDVIPLEQVVKLGILGPKSLPNAYEQFQLAFAVKMAPGSLMIHLNYVPAAGGTPSDFLILDFDYYVQGTIPVANLAEHLDNSHAHTKQIFESLMTEEYHRFMRGEAE